MGRDATCVPANRSPRGGEPDDSHREDQPGDSCADCVGAADTRAKDEVLVVVTVGLGPAPPA